MPPNKWIYPKRLRPMQEHRQNNTPWLHWVKPCQKKLIFVSCAPAKLTQVLRERLPRVRHHNYTFISPHDSLKFRWNSPQPVPGKEEFFCVYYRQETASALPTTRHYLSATKGDTLMPWMFKTRSFVQAEKQTIKSVTISPWFNLVIGVMGPTNKRPRSQQ